MVFYFNDHVPLTEIQKTHINLRPNRTVQRKKKGESVKQLVVLDGQPHAVCPETEKLIYKTFMVVTSGFRKDTIASGENPYLCNKKCPFCTAMITRWPRVEDRWELMSARLDECQRNEIWFEYLTISGNGEPSLVPVEELAYLKQVFDQKLHLFGYRRFQTGGAIFFIDRVFDLFGREFTFEITRLSVDDEEDMAGLVYKGNYTQTDAFKSAKVVFNIVLLKDNVRDVLSIINRYVERFGDILAGLNLKILNVNTFDEAEVKNPQSQWILHNGLLKAEGDQVVRTMDQTFCRLEENFDPFLDRYVWNGPALPSGRQIPITLYARRAKYGLANVVYYGGNLVDYQLQPIRVPTSQERERIFAMAREETL